MVQTGERKQTYGRTNGQTDATKHIISPATWSITSLLGMEIALQGIHVGP